MAGSGTNPLTTRLVLPRRSNETGFLPFVLPLNWNFRPRYHRAFFGPLKIWHDYADVPVAVHDILRYYERPDAIVLFHAAGAA
jgi:hypothetical protein